MALEGNRRPRKAGRSLPVGICHALFRYRLRTVFPSPDYQETKPSGVHPSEGQNTGEGGEARGGSLFMRQICQIDTMKGEHRTHV